MTSTREYMTHRFSVAAPAASIMEQLRHPQACVSHPQLGTRLRRDGRCAAELHDRWRESEAYGWLEVLDIDYTTGHSSWAFQFRLAKSPALLGGRMDFHVACDGPATAVSTNLLVEGSSFSAQDAKRLHAVCNTLPEAIERGLRSHGTLTPADSGTSQPSHTSRSLRAAVRSVSPGMLLATTGLAVAGVTIGRLLACRKFAGK